jgi:hypothetical protein
LLLISEQKTPHFYNNQLHKRNVKGHKNTL